MQNKIKVKVKRLSENSKIPQYAKQGDAGMDLTAVTRSAFDYNNLTQTAKVKYGTGLAFEIPEGYVGLIFPRSSICKKDMNLTNSVGVIDSGYRGEVSFVFETANLLINHYEVGDRIGQIIIMPYPQIEFEEVEELDETERGTGGFGSSGN